MTVIITIAASRRGITIIQWTTMTDSGWISMPAILPRMKKPATRQVAPQRSGGQSRVCKMVVARGRKRLFAWRAVFGNVAKLCGRSPPEFIASSDCADRTAVSDLTGNSGRSFLCRDSACKQPPSAAVCVSIAWVDRPTRTLPLLAINDLATLSAAPVIGRVTVAVSLGNDVWMAARLVAPLCLELVGVFDGHSWQSRCVLST